VTTERAIEVLRRHGTIWMSVIRDAQEMGADAQERLQRVAAYREKILKALSVCLPETEEDGKLNCEDCPYWGRLDYVNLPVGMVEDIRRILREGEVPKEDE